MHSKATWSYQLIVLKLVVPEQISSSVLFQADEKRTMEKRRAEGDKYSEVRKVRADGNDSSFQRNGAGLAVPCGGGSQNEHVATGEAT